MGTFYWQSRQKWAAQLTMGDGKRATATCHHDHPTRGRGPCQEARDLLADLERLRESQAPANARTLTLGKFLLGWLDDVKPTLAYSTWRKHESICRTHITPLLGHRRLSDLSVVDVRRLMEQAQSARPSRVGHRERDPALDGQTLRHLRGTLRRALADAQRQGLVSRNVASLAQPPKLSHRERPILNADQARALIEGTQDDRYHALYVLALTTGMRSAEMLGLTWEDIDLGNQDRGNGYAGGHRAKDGSAGRAGRDVAGPTASVSVGHTLVRVGKEWRLGAPKTDKSRRVIPLTPLAVSALRDHRQRQLAERMAAGKPGTDGLVFTTPTGKPVWGSNLLPLLRAHLARLGLPKVGIHDLRHSAATILFGMGVPIEVISDILGHATTRITADLYRHRVEALSVEAAKRMQEAVG